jgi:pyrroloquinoline quinone biosynthesis protein B
MIQKLVFLSLVFFLFSACSNKKENEALSIGTRDSTKTQLIVLGTLQDGGAPHIGCTKACCANLWAHPNPDLKVVSLGIVDSKNRTFLFEASPDLPVQLTRLNQFAQQPLNTIPSAVFLTHAHIGHYSGLMYFGREAMGAKNIQVFALPRMKQFLLKNGPWSQLSQINNIRLDSLPEETEVILSPDLRVQAIRVPHRDEFSETVGFVITGKNKKVLFIPDIDKWAKWKRDLIAELAKVDVAYIDATFYDATELNNRSMAEVPHPLVIETMSLLETLPNSEKNKVHFIHMNHTNPLLDTLSAAYKNVREKGFRVAKVGELVDL